MNIKPMLVRLQGTLDRNDLSEKMLLLPGVATTVKTDSEKAINLVVGYNNSPNSHTALDLTLWIAHQTRLVTRKPVIVQVVHVVQNKTELFEQTDRFQQAHYLAQEWGGNLKTHLCCGSVSTELRRVVEVESADLLFLGCSVNHPVIQKLGDDFPCPVLGIPKALTIKQAIEEKIECLMQPSNFG